MRLIIHFIVIGLISQFSYGQLSISNNAYVFVDGTGFTSGPNVAPLFVTDDVRIENTSDIYLRNDAQLLQGAGTTGNSGVGKLSVFQSGTVHNWAYNYWASPVGNVDIDANGNSRFRPNTNFYDWIGNVDPALASITSAPTAFTSAQDGTSSPLTISNNWLYAYNAGSDYYDWGYIGESGNLLSGYGFSMKGSIGSTNQLYDFRGKPNNGVISINIIAGNFTLAGNPYPSALDTVSFIHDPVNISSIDGPLTYGTLLFWDHDLSVTSHGAANYIGGYARYTISADGLVESFTDAMYAAYDANAEPTVSPGASTSGKTVYRYLPIGQGFMIEGRATGNAQFINSHRVYYKQSDTASEFFRTTQSENSQNRTDSSVEFNYNELGYQIIDNPYKRFRLNVNFNNAYTRQLLHNFHPTATIGFDYGLESNNSETASNDAYYIFEDMPYITQANNFDIDLRIPLIIKVEQNMPVEMHMFDIQNFDNQNIFIHDISTDLYYNLTEQNFQVILEAGLYDNRFEITFKDANALSIWEFDDSDFSIFQNNTLAQLVISNPNNLAIKSLSLVDVAGKQIMNNINLTGETRYEFSTRNLSDGVYIVSVKLENNEVENKKIVVANK